MNANYALGMLYILFEDFEMSQDFLLVVKEQYDQIYPKDHPEIYQLEELLKRVGYM